MKYPYKWHIGSPREAGFYNALYIAEDGSVKTQIMLWADNCWSDADQRAQVIGWCSIAKPKVPKITVIGKGQYKICES